MRLCKNEAVDVYEADGTNLSHLLIEAAGLVENLDGYIKVDTLYNMEDGGYIVTVYAH